MTTTATMVLTLAKPSVEFGPSYNAMVQACIDIGEGYPYNNIELAKHDFAAFVRELEEEAQGIGLPPGISPQQTYLLIKDGSEVIGELRFRPTIPQPYEEQNGHIAYNLHPSARRKGYATRMLALVLDEARALSMEGVMLTIEEENPASVRVIEKNGGKLLKQFHAESGERVSCYWIDLTTAR